MITAPRHGERMRADWGADVARAVNALAPCGARGLVREGVAGCGAEPLPGNPRAMRRKPHVFEVFAHAEDGDSSPLLTIHLPAGCVWYGGESLVPDGVTALGASRPDEWEFDFESDLGETKTVIYLVISEDDYGEVSAEFVKALADVGGTVKAVLPVAEVSIETVTEGSGSITAGVVHRQLARHPFTVGVGGGGEVYDSKVTIYRYDGTTEVGSFTVNQGEDSSIILPQIPAVSDETIIIAKSDGTTIGSFTLNQSPGKTIRLPPIPDVPSPPTDYVTSISDLDLSVENPTSAQPSLKISFKYNLKNGTSVPLSKSLNLMRDDVVRSSEYSTSTHKLVNKVSKATVFGLSTVADATPPVFQATPHSGEH